MAVSSPVRQRSCCICVTILNSDTKVTRGTNICGGCKKRFCSRHYETHREDINKEFQQLRQERDLLANQLNSISLADPMVSSLVMEINEWETETIEKVRSAAAIARTNVTSLIHDRNIIKDKFNEFIVEFKNEEFINEYDETDIEHIKSKLNILQQQANTLSNETIRIKYQDIKWNAMILICKSDSYSLLSEQTIQLDSNSVATKTYFRGTTLLAPYHEIILNEFCGTQNYQWQLLYKATIDGFKPKDFHRQCNRKKPTVTIYRDSTTCYLFGGFTRAEWITPRTTYSTQQDSQAFLFTLTNPHSLTPRKFPIRTDMVSATFNSKNFGPSFGLVNCPL